MYYDLLNINPNKAGRFFLKVVNLSLAHVKNAFENKSLTSLDGVVFENIIGKV